MLEHYYQERRIALREYSHIIIGLNKYRRGKKSVQMCLYKRISTQKEKDRP